MFPKVSDMHKNVTQRKAIEAFIIGFIGWFFAVIAIIAFGKTEFYISNVILTVALIAPPAIYYLLKFHLRSVGKDDKRFIAAQFGVLATLIQFPLDFFGWLIIFKYDFQFLPQEAREATLLALLIGYFFMLGVPWLASKNRKLNKHN